jgi:hypothetical protein
MVAAIAESIGRQERAKQLEREIVQLSVRLNAATYELLTRIAELDALGEWHGDGFGFRSFAHWLNWRVGIALGAAREKVRVAKALQSLPRLSEAFRKGAVSYSKVRAITRIATPETEADLLNIALYGTAAHVERTVRLYRRCEALALADASKQAETRGLRIWRDESGMVCVEGRLPAEQGAVVMKALEVVQDDIYRELRPAGEDQLPSRPQRLADALARLSEGALAHKAESQGDSDAFQVVVHVDQEVLSHDAAGLCAVEDGQAVSAETVRRLACDASVVTVREDGQGNVIDLGRKRRVVSRALRRALKARDASCCFPACGAEHHLQAHHIKHWAQGGETKLENLLNLCSYHHHLLHEGGFTVRLDASGKPKFTSPHGRPLEPCPLLPPVYALDHDWHHVSAETPAPRLVSDLESWNGDRMDYDMAMEALLGAAGGKVTRWD